jgi:DNA-binding response OmpR family regulator
MEAAKAFKFAGETSPKRSNIVQVETTGDPIEQEHRLAFGPSRLDVGYSCLWQGEHFMALPPRSLAMVRYLVEHPGRLVIKAELRQHVWAGAHVTDVLLHLGGCGSSSCDTSRTS